VKKKSSKNASREPARSTSSTARAKPRAPSKPLVSSKPRAQGEPVAGEPVGVAEQEALRAKFELGPHEWTRTLDARERAQTIPWGYGRDMVTAMAVDPERLFAYWEVTDEAIVRARAHLQDDGHPGDDAALALRIHDVTDVIFDGDNANHSFDVRIARSDRQWFLQIGRPTSTVVVELGLLARDGAFRKIARSRRVDFPRREALRPGPERPVEWMTVTSLAAAERPPRRGRGAALEIRERRGGRGSPRLIRKGERGRGLDGGRRDGAARAGSRASRGLAEAKRGARGARSASGSEARLSASLDLPSSPSARRGSPPGASRKS
jgi:hypothetical protein